MPSNQSSSELLVPALPLDTKGRYQKDETDQFNIDHQTLRVVQRANAIDSIRLDEAKGLAVKESLRQEALAGVEQRRVGIDMKQWEGWFGGKECFECEVEHYGRVFSD